ARRPGRRRGSAAGAGPAVAPAGAAAATAGAAAAAAATTGAAAAAATTAAAAAAAARPAANCERWVGPGGATGPLVHAVRRVLQRSGQRRTVALHDRVG